MLANWLIAHGFSRDDQIWIWGRMVGAAAAIASGVFDLRYWATYLSIPLSVQVERVITVAAVAVLYVAGRQASSRLPSKVTVEARKEIADIMLGNQGTGDGTLK